MKMFKLTREDQIPKGAVEQRDEQSDAVAYLYPSPGNGKPSAMVFFGKQSKPIWRHYYPTEEARAKAIMGAFEGRRQRQASIAERRKTPSSTAVRNGEIKKLLSKAFAPHKVSVTGGRGTASGWVDVHVGYAPRNRREWQELRSKVEQLIAAAGIKLGTYYADDGFSTARSEILIDFDHCREKADGYGPEAWKHNLSAEDWDALQKEAA